MKGDFQWKLNQSKNDNTELIEKLEKLIKLRSFPDAKQVDSINNQALEQARQVLDQEKGLITQEQKVTEVAIEKLGMKSD